MSTLEDVLDANRQYKLLGTQESYDVRTGKLDGVAKATTAGRAVERVV